MTIETRKFTSNQLQFLTAQMFDLRDVLDKRYGENHWSCFDPDFKKLQFLGKAVDTGSLKPERAKKTSKTDHAWGLVLKYLGKVQFKSLSNRTKLTFEQICELNSLYRGVIEPIFGYECYPVVSGKKPIYCLTYTQAMELLHTTGKGGKMAVRKRTEKKGYWILEGKYTWSRLAIGDWFCFSHSLIVHQKIAEKFNENF